MVRSLPLLCIWAVVPARGEYTCRTHTHRSTQRSRFSSSSLLWISSASRLIAACLRSCCVPLSLSKLFAKFHSYNAKCVKSATEGCTYMYMYMYTCSPHITCTLVPFYIFSNVNFHKVLLSFFKPTVRTCIVEIDCMGVNKTFDRVLRAFAWLGSNHLGYIVHTTVIALQYFCTFTFCDYKIQST